MSRVSLLLTAFLATTLPAVADETRVCWVEPGGNAIGEMVYVTVCRINGEIVEYASESSVPGRLYPGIGYDGAGTECWYLTSAQTNWVIITRYGDNTADLGYQPQPGGPIAIEQGIPVCTSEPVIIEPGVTLAYDLIVEYVHQRPQPLLNPEPPKGLAGLETFVGLAPPPPFDASLISPSTGSVLEAHAEVAAVTITWGDGMVETFAASTFPLLSGYPEGVARHVYEAKTCDPPGSRPRCHPDLSVYPFSVSYQWSARWRVDGGIWEALAVPPTTTAVAYPVTEIVAVLLG